MTVRVELSGGFLLKWVLHVSLEDIIHFVVQSLWRHDVRIFPNGSLELRERTDIP